MKQIDNLIIKNLENEKLDEFFELFKSLLETQFTEYSKRTRKFLYANSRTINKEELQRKMKKDIVLAAFSNKQIIGILIADLPFGGVSFCHWLAVDPKFQRKGVGKILLKTWEEQTKTLGAHNLRLESRESNIPFYEKIGFKVLGFDKKGYFGTDNYILVKLIQEPKEANFLKI